MASLQEQLLKAGVVDGKKAQKIKKEQRKDAKAKKGQKSQKGKEHTDPQLSPARVAMEEQAQRDRELNKAKQERAEHKALAAQVLQIIQMNRIDRGAGEIAYQFVDGTVIKKLFVTAQLQNDLVAGRIAIAKAGDTYELLPAAAAEKIMQRDDTAIVVLNSCSEPELAEDDPYADYQVPDDLMW